MLVLNKKVIMLGITFVLVAAGTGVFLAIRSSAMSKGFPEFLSTAQRQGHIARERGWKKSEWVLASSSPVEMARQWEGLFRDPENLVPDEHKSSLLAMISKFAHAYSAQSADEYVNLVESLPWLVWRPDSEKLHPYLEYYTERPYLPDGAPTARELLLEVWPDIMVNDSRSWQNGWVRVGAGRDGALFIADKVYSASPGNGLGTGTEAEFDKWAGAPMHGYFHNFTWTASEFAPAEDSREILPAIVDEYVSAVIVYAHVMVATKQGWPFVWSSRWVWHPTREIWICDEMIVGTGRVVSGIF